MKKKRVMLEWVINYRQNTKSEQEYWVWSKIIFNWWASFLSLLAREFSIKAAESNLKCLQCTKRISEIHSKNIIIASTKLHDNIIRIWIVDELKIFDWGLCDATMKIKHIRLCFVIPYRCLISQFHQTIHIFSFPTIQYTLMWIIWCYFYAFIAVIQS